MDFINHQISRLRGFTSGIEPWWTIIGAPVIQETLFRFIPYQFLFIPTGKFWLIGVASAMVYALIHWYFGVKIIFGSFFLGLVLWWIMVKFGLIPAIAFHLLVNLLILLILGEKWLAK